MFLITKHIVELSHSVYDNAKAANSNNFCYVNSNGNVNNNNANNSNGAVFGFYGLWLFRAFV